MNDVTVLSLQFGLNFLCAGVLWQMPRLCLVFYIYYRRDPYLRKVKPYYKKYNYLSTCLASTKYLGNYRGRHRLSLYIKNGRCLFWVYLCFCVFMLVGQAPSINMVWQQGLFFILLLLAWYDLKFMVLPDQILLILTLIGSIYSINLGTDIFLRRTVELVFLVIFCLLMRVLLQRKQLLVALGLGDYKFIWALVYCLGLQHTLYALLCACVLSLLWFLLVRWPLGKLHQNIAFGPWLAAAVMFVYQISP